MKRMRVPVLWLLYVVTAFFFLSCGLPGELKKQAKQKSGQIEKARKTVEEQKTRFSKFKESEKFGFFKVYAEREDWEASFQEALDAAVRYHHESYATGEPQATMEIFLEEHAARRKG